MQEYFSKLAAQFVASIPNIIAALLIFFVSLYFARLLANLLTRMLARRKTDTGVVNLLAKTLQWTIIVFGGVAALQRFFNVTAFLTGLGIIGFTVGFALQNVMQNFVSGVILLVQQPFKTGDEINVMNFDGTVNKIDLRTTEMETLDGRIVILPNADVLSHAIVNYTRANRRCVDMPLTIPHTADPEVVRALLLDTVKDVPGYVSAPETRVLFERLDGASIGLTVSFWVDTSKIRTEDAKADAIVLAKAAFKKKKIEIPLPIQMVLRDGK